MRIQRALKRLGMRRHLQADSAHVIAHELYYKREHVHTDDRNVKLNCEHTHYTAHDFETSREHSHTSARYFHSANAPADMRI